MFHMNRNIVHIINIYLAWISIPGGSDDWALGSGGFQYSYTIELPPKGGPGFELPPSRILPVGKEMHAGVAAMVSKLIKDSN